MKFEEIINENWGEPRRAYAGRRMEEHGDQIATEVNRRIHDRFNDESKHEYWRSVGRGGAVWTRSRGGFPMGRYRDALAQLELDDRAATISDKLTGGDGYGDGGRGNRNVRRRAITRIKAARKEMQRYLEDHGQPIDLEDVGMEEMTGYRIGKYIYVPGPYTRVVAIYSPNKLRGLLRRREAPAA